MAIGFSPADIILHRFIWAGFVFLPFLARDGLGHPGAVGWRKGALLTLLGGPTFAFFSYAGFLFVPLAHGGVIQPSCAALGGLVLATILLKERLPAQRAAGALVIVGGLVVIGGDALANIGMHGLIGDLSFATAGLMYATFATLLRFWRIEPFRAVVVTSVISLVYLPVHWLFFGFERIFALGLVENLLQLTVQGVLAGAGATYLFTRSVGLLGAGRAAVFASLVPGFTIVIGFVALGEMPSVGQVAGFSIVMLGFWLTQRVPTKVPT
jgi:drug/metabolite transporter (DMT)-like permease